jgi:hypothetical protein
MKTKLQKATREKVIKKMNWQTIQELELELNTQY